MRRSRWTRKVGIEGFSHRGQSTQAVTSKPTVVSPCLCSCPQTCGRRGASTAHGAADLSPRCGQRHTGHAAGEREELSLSVASILLFLPSFGLRLRAEGVLFDTAIHISDCDARSPVLLTRGWELSCTGHRGPGPSVGSGGGAGEANTAAAEQLGQVNWGGGCALHRINLGALEAYKPPQDQLCVLFHSVVDTLAGWTSQQCTHSA